MVVITAKRSENTRGVAFRARDPTKLRGIIQILFTTSCAPKRSAADLNLGKDILIAIGTYALCCRTRRVVNICQPSMMDANRDVFPFLSLPKELRLMVYDFLPIEIRHHSITFWQSFNDYALTIVSKRLPGISLLATCKQIHSEATALHSKRESLSAEPLRIMAHYRALNHVVMKAVLSCASRDPRACGGNKDLERVMQEMKYLREGGGCLQQIPWVTEPTNFRTNLELRLPPMSPDLHIMGCDFNTHEELHALLRYNGESGTRRLVEVAVDCTLDTLPQFLRLDCSQFYSWLAAMNRGRTGDVDMHISLRPMPQTDDIKVMLELDYAFWNEYNPPSAFRGRRWSYELGDWVEGEERADVWEEGEKF